MRNENCLFVAAQRTHFHILLVFFWQFHNPKSFSLSLATDGMNEMKISKFNPNNSTQKTFQSSTHMSTFLEDELKLFSRDKNFSFLVYVKFGIFCGFNWEWRRWSYKSSLIEVNIPHQNQIIINYDLICFLIFFRLPE